MCVCLRVYVYIRIHIYNIYNPFCLFCRRTHPRTLTSENNLAYIYLYMYVYILSCVYIVLCVCVYIHIYIHV